jgi:hypothetical protein
VEVIVLRCHRGLVVGLPLLVDEVQALGQTTTAVLRRLTQPRQVLELLGSFRATAVVREPATDPAQAVLLDDHQARLLAEENLVGGRLLDAWTALVVQDGGQGRAAASGLLGQAPELSHARWLPLLGRLGGLGDDHGEASATDRQSETFGLGGAGKSSAAVVVQEEGVGELVLELRDAKRAGSELVAELLELRVGIVTVEGVQDGVGIAVKGLPRESEPVGSLGDGAVGSFENSSSMGDTEFGG